MCSVYNIFSAGSNDISFNSLYFSFFSSTRCTIKSEILDNSAYFSQNSAESWQKNCNTTKGLSCLNWVHTHYRKNEKGTRTSRTSFVMSVFVARQEQKFVRKAEVMSYTCYKCAAQIGPSRIRSTNSLTESQVTNCFSPVDEHSFVCFT